MTANNANSNEESGQVLLEPDIEFRKYRVFKSRSVKNLWNILLALIPVSGLLYILGIHQRLGLSLYAEQYIGLFFGLFLSAIFLSVPINSRASKESVPWYDWILAALGLNAGLYIVIYYPTIVLDIGTVTTGRFILSVIAILLILEAIRRVLGKGLLIVVLIFMAYGFFAPHFPGVFKGTGTSVEQLFSYMYLDSNSLLSMLNVAATLALSFIFFGQILLLFGGADILNDIAISAFGRFRGGPAKAAVLGSSLVGTITGGPVANVILTGNVTIPLMKKNGYTAAQAGAVESVASTGGQIMPPVMGIAAFIIAETLGVPYTDVALAALVPALMFYICLFFQVDFIAGRRQLKRLSKENIPVFTQVMKKGWMIVPTLGSLIYFLFFLGTSPAIAGLYASGIAIIFLSFEKTTRQKIVSLIPQMFVDTGKTMLEIGIVLAAAGLVVGITGVTGLGFNLGLILSSFAEYGLFVLLVLSAIVSIILGMGMPSVAAYALVSVLVAPTLVELGVDQLSAHLFVFYFSIVSNFTPPVAMACFTAAPIAKENPNKIGFQAMQLGIIGYLVPFLFVYAPEMLIRKEAIVPLGESIVTIGTMVLGCYLMAMALEGFFFRKISTVKRIVVAVLAVCLFVPISVWEYSHILNGVAFVLTVFFMINEWRTRGNVQEELPIKTVV
ncbi:C4-dicarboxylate ABC transporter permease [Bacillus sp. M6-12]|uniref:TRAP transporter permease n=1 Tax=Bacillus sp. M6-12 TaxID=2054166 RepID=UPI000C77251A|nr:TRAP transporter fused permease subunit [Bacillus sp. M6-12]PLS17043.1 C4-dicarboxylate ABC transporter permease [Bacillus sp. M6-12]